MSLDYLKALIKPDAPYYKITRDNTRTLPITNYKRRFDAKKTLKILEKILVEKKLKPTGFNRWQPPDISWMLRLILYLKPE